MTLEQEVAFVTDLPELEGYRPALHAALADMATDKASVAWRLGAAVTVHGSQVAGARATGRPIDPALARLIRDAITAADQALGAEVTSLLTVLLLGRWYRAHGCCGTCGVYGHGPIGCPVLRAGVAQTRAARN